MLQARKIKEKSRSRSSVDGDYTMMVHIYEKVINVYNLCVYLYKRLSLFSLRDEMICKEGLLFTETASNNCLIIIMFNSD